MLRSTTDTLSDDSVQLERNATRPAMVSSFAAVRELTYLSEIRRALVAGESALCVLHARQSILLLFKLWTSDSCSAFPLDVLGGQKFFSDFVRLLDFDSHPTLAPETSWSVFHNALKILIFNELSLRQGSFDSNTPLTKALHKETLISLLYLSQDETRSLNVDTEHVALKHVSAELALFLLQTLCDVALESNQRWLLGQAVTNIMFAAMSADRVTINVRIALIRLMTRLIRADVTIEVRHLLPVKQSMNQLHSMTTSTPELTPLLLALIDLVIAADNSQTVKVAMNAYLKRFSEANEHRRLIEAQRVLI
jgi:hypothetical protein